MEVPAKGGVVTTSLTIQQDRGPATVVTEADLVEAARWVAWRVAEKPEILAALAAAESIPPGIVISGETEAVALVDAMRSVIQGEKALEAQLAAILRIPKAMETVIRQAVADARGRLSVAKARGNDARVAWQAEVRRRAAAEEARVKREADEAAAKAAAEAALTGEDEPPPAEVAPVVVPRTVSAGAASSGTMVRIEAKEVVDPAACPKHWLVVVRAIAEGHFRSDEAAGKVRRAAPGESVVWRGVRFASVERATNR